MGDRREQMLGKRWTDGRQKGTDVRQKGADLQQRGTDVR